REYAAFCQERSIRLKSIKCLFKRSRYAADFFFIFVRQIVDVFVKRSIAKCNWIKSFFNTIKTCKQHSCKRKIWVSCCIRRTEFDAAAFWRYCCNWNSYCCRTVTFREYKVYRCFVAWYKTLEGVSTWISQCNKCW